ncbi:MAG: tetratricopeptide repeat protein [Candidatus Theseobacter exili]|nr:tetratricopeptide repeat protein [Candidatus Theseobacter exili]
MLDNAVWAYETCLSIDADFADARFNLGLLYTEMRRYKTATEQYISLLYLEPGNPDALFNLAVLYDKHLKNKVLANKYYHEYMLVNPGSNENEKRIVKRRIIKTMP